MLFCLFGYYACSYTKSASFVTKTHSPRFYFISNLALVEIVSGVQCDQIG